MKKILLLILLSLMCSLSVHSQLIDKDLDSDNIFSEYYNWNINRIDVWEYDEIPFIYRLNMKDMVFPLKKTYVTSNYGYRRSFNRNHRGIDLKAQIGDTIYAAFDGKVRIQEYNKGGYGNYIVIRHDQSVETIYAHLSKSLVTKNDKVYAGQPIGLSGNTGRSTGPHLHFEIRFMGIAINPAKIADFENNVLLSDNYMFIKEKQKRRG